MCEKNHSTILYPIYVRLTTTFNYGTIGATTVVGLSLERSRWIFTNDMYRIK